MQKMNNSEIKYFLSNTIYHNYKIQLNIIPLIFREVSYIIYLFHYFSRNMTRSSPVCPLSH